MGLLGLDLDWEGNEKKGNEDQNGVIYWWNKSRRYGMLKPFHVQGYYAHIRNEECISHVIQADSMLSKEKDAQLKKRSVCITTYPL